MLKVDKLNVHYGVINAVKNVSFEVNEGEIVALIGANGAGKTSIMHALSGLLKVTSGDIVFMNKNITKIPAHKIIANGLAQVPEGRRIFAQLSVADNLEMGAYLRTDKIGIKRDLENIYKRFPRLGERKSQLAGTLSGGEQQMLAMGRALMSRPKLLLLDEPTNHIDIETREILEDALSNYSGTLLFVSHDRYFIDKLAQRKLVIENNTINSVYCDYK